MRQRLRYLRRITTRKPARYRFLLRHLRRSRARTIVEIGTHKGSNAVQMIETASLAHPVDEVEYFGFDLFEDLTAEDLERELSLRPPSFETVRRKLQRTGAAVELYRGYTQTTLSEFLEMRGEGRPVGFVFVDGGHSVETIASDWSFVRRLMSPDTVVVFDDYYLNGPDELPGVGCQSLVDGLDRSEYEVELCRSEDRFQHDWGVLRIKMARVRKRR